MIVDGRHEFQRARLTETALIKLYVATFHERIKLFPSPMQHCNGKPTILKHLLRRGGSIAVIAEGACLSKAWRHFPFIKPISKGLWFSLWNLEKMNQPIRGAEVGMRYWPWIPCQPSAASPCLVMFDTRSRFGCHDSANGWIGFVAWCFDSSRPLCFVDLWWWIPFKASTSVSNDTKLIKKSSIGDMLQVHNIQ